jgi:hypothetical protein
MEKAKLSDYAEELAKRLSNILRIIRNKWWKEWSIWKQIKKKCIYFISHFHAYQISLPVYKTYRAVFLRYFSLSSFSFSPLLNQKMICIKKTIVPLLSLQCVVTQNKLRSMLVLNGFNTMSGLLIQIQ